MPEKWFAEEQLNNEKRGVPEDLVSKRSQKWAGMLEKL